MHNKKRMSSGEKENGKQRQKTGNHIDITNIRSLTSNEKQFFHDRLALAGEPKNK